MICNNAGRRKMDKNTKIVLKKKLNVTDLAGEKVMVDFDNGKYFLIKGVGNDIWDMVQNDITPNEIIEKLLRIEHAAYQFSYRSLRDPRVIGVVKRLMNAKKPILLGTGWDQPEKCLSNDLFGDMEAAKPSFSKSEWNALLQGTRKFWA